MRVLETHPPDCPWRQVLSHVRLQFLLEGAFTGTIDDDARVSKDAAVMLANLPREKIIETPRLRSEIFRVDVVFPDDDRTAGETRV